MPYMGPVPYTSFYGQYSTPPGPKPGEGPYYPPIYIPMAHPSQSHGGQDGDNQGYPPQHSHFYPTTFLTPYAQPYPSYVMHRADGQLSLPGPHYAAYAPMYHKPPSAESSSDLGGLRDHMSGDNGSMEKSG
jgi:hypothetical protein